jgi:tetratricopeptide (TPR) repeat protein
MFVENTTGRLAYRTLLILLEIVLVIVCASALIRWVMTPPDPGKELARKEAKFKKQHDVKFAALVAEGNKDASAGQYDVALAKFRQAERTTAYLTDDQYNSLKQGMENVASASGGTEASYQALVDSGNYEGGYWQKRNNCDTAIARFQDAENYADHLTSTKQAALVEARRGQVQCYRSKQAFGDSIEASDRLIDSLRAGSDPYSRDLVSAYLELAQTYSQQGNWAQSQMTLLNAWRLCDGRISHLTGVPGQEARLSEAFQDKELTLNWLVVAYKNMGEVDHALATAQELYNVVDQRTPAWTTGSLYSRRDVAQLAMQIASQVNRQDAVAAWRARAN